MLAEPEEARGGSTIWIPHQTIMPSLPAPRPTTTIGLSSSRRQKLARSQHPAGIALGILLTVFSSRLYRLYAHTESQRAGDL
jgi:hypothetical protein